jgi:hypothetical protein
MRKKMRFAIPEKIHPAVIAVWAAVIAAAHIIPTVPIFGTGRNFSLASALFPLSGILFGPLAGSLCSAAGGFVGNIAAPHTAWMGMGTFIIGTTTSFTSGCIAWGSWPPVTVNQKGNFVINGGIIVYVIGSLLWFSQEIGRNTVVFPLVVYGLGFTALIAGCIFACKALAGKNAVLKFSVVWLCAFGGMIGGSAVGNFFTLILYRNPREFWLPLTAIAPLERSIFSVGTALIGVPLLAALPKIGISVGPNFENSGSFPIPSQDEPAHED